jgi:uncharacterized membrane protein YgaE (UPF0421/DUF939 family)
MNFGARIIKTGIAVTLALYASTLLRLPSPTIAAVAAVFAMQPSIYRSWRYFWEQIQTNTLGAFIAMTALYFFHNEPIAVGLVCILVIMLCLKMRMEETLGLTLVTVIAIMEAPGGQLDFALNRFSLSCIGILCAFVVNLLLFPPNPQKQFLDQFQNGFNRLSLLLRTLVSDEMKEKVFQQEKKKLLGAIKNLNSKYQLFEEEQKKLKRPSQVLARRLVVFKQMLAVLTKGSEILETAEQHYFQAVRPKGTDRSFDLHLEKLVKRHEYALLKFEGKIKQESDEAAGLAEDNARFLEEMLAAIRGEAPVQGHGLEHEQGLVQGHGVAQVHGPVQGQEHAQQQLEPAQEREPAGLRLAVVAALIYDYGHQIVRLDRLIEHYQKGQTSRNEGSLRRLVKRWLP